MKNLHRCKIAGCDRPGLIDLSTGNRVDGKPNTQESWVCAEHFQEGIHCPLSRAQMELDEHLEDGGLLS
jgi:hypothetical protein